tara:strand:+ start:1118 stop:1447 length:330 start_codon:yes stop_codon:yes gene_type:complete
MKYDIQIKLTQWDIMQLPSISAIYFWHFNNLSRPHYIGQTINIKRRMQEYKNGAEINNRTHNIYLTNFIKSKKNRESIIIKIIYVKKEERLKIEKKYIDELIPKYNIVI